MLTRTTMLVAASVLLADILPAQSNVRVVRDARACATCEIILKHAATLGGLDKIVGNTVYLPADAYSRYYVAVPEDPGHFTVHNSKGAVIKTVGRKGKGPGEFSGILRPFMAPGNELHVFDNGALRLTVFDTVGRRLREFQVPRGIERIALFTDGGFVANGDFRTPSSIGFPLHYFDRKGHLIRSFGTQAPMRAPGLETRHVKRLAVVNDSLFWSVAESEYVLELWNARSGKLVRRLRRAASWFPTDAGRNDITPNQPPKPFVQGLNVDAQGHIWVLLLTSDPRWRSNITPRKLRGEAASYRANYPRVYDAIIEVIDPINATLITSSRFDQFIRGFSRTDLVFSFREDNSGTPLLDVWNASLTTNRRKP